MTRTLALLLCLSAALDAQEDHEAVRKTYDASVKLEKGKRKLLFRIIRAGYRRLIVLDFEKDMEKIEEE